MMDIEFIGLDILTSVLAFAGLASLVLCYLSYIPKWFDTLAFFLVFFAFGWYCALGPETPTSYRVLTASSFAVGILVVLALKVWLLKQKAKKQTKA